MLLIESKCLFITIYEGNNEIIHIYLQKQFSSTTFTNLKKIEILYVSTYIGSYLISK